MTAPGEGLTHELQVETGGEVIPGPAPDSEPAPGDGDHEEEQ
jgi:hypothetical protein